MPSNRSAPRRVITAARSVVRSMYVPGLVVGGAMQFAAVFPGSGSLAAAGLVLGAGADLLTADEEHPWRGRLRRAGLGVVQRASLRFLLVLATITDHAIPPLTAVWFVVAAVAAVVAPRFWRWSLEKVLFTEPAMGVRNLAGDGTLTGLFDRTRRRRTVGSGVLVGAELPIGLAMVAGADGAISDGTVRLWLAAVTAVVVAVAMTAYAWSRSFRRSGRVDRHLATLRDQLAAHGAPVIVYFSGAPDTTYQLNQWVPVLDRLTVPVLFVLRERHHLDQLMPTRWPILYCRRTRDVEEALTPSARVALYVSNAGKNLHLQRFPQLEHVFLNHGDSDKASSANPVVRVYDLLFVAGELAIDRYHDAGIEVPRERFRIVGRPQLDGVKARPIPVSDGPLTVLYAPTWEGLFAAADYSSVERMGVALVRGILEHRPDVRVVFKPHPMTGTVRAGARASMERIEELLRDAGSPHVIATDHPRLDLFAWFDGADVLVSDISAVVTDWLATSRPYLVTNPRDLPPDEFDRAYPSHTAAYRVGRDLTDLPAALNDALGDDRLADARARMTERVLGEHPEGPQASFGRVVRDVVDHAEKRWQLHRGGRPEAADEMVEADAGEVADAGG